MLKITVQHPRTIPDFIQKRLPELNKGFEVPTNTARLPCCGNPECYTELGIKRVQNVLVRGVPLETTWGEKKSKWHLFMRAPRVNPDYLIDQFATRKDKEWSERSTSMLAGSQATACSHEAVIRRLLLGPFPHWCPNGEAGGTGSNYLNQFSYRKTDERLAGMSPGDDRSNAASPTDNHGS